MRQENTMSANSVQLRLVIVHNPYSVWDHILVPKLFHDMVQLKKDGYSSMYSKPVMPVDTTDFIATHILLCLVDSKENLKPIMGYKSTTLKDCENYDLVFPALSLVKNAGAVLHTSAVQSLVETCRSKNLSLAYLASWTLDHKIKNEFFLKHELRDIFIASYYFLYQQLKISQIIIGGTLRFGTDKIFKAMGHQPLEWNKKILEPILAAHLAKEPVQVMCANHLPDSLRLVASRWKKLWNERLIIEPEEVKARKAA